MFFLLLVILLEQPATTPAPPADPTVDFLLNAAAPTSRPTTLPASRPAAPFEAKRPAGARRATLVLSDGRRIVGDLTTTPEKPIRVWDEQAKEYRDVPFALIKSMEAQVLWEREEREWHFKDSGSDIKEYSGKTYPARELQYTLVLANGQKVTGGIVAPLYAHDGEDARTFVLNKRHKGDVGQTLKDLAYVKRVDFE